MAPTVAGASRAERIVHDLFRTPLGRLDPHPLCHALRETAPVHRSEEVHAWVFTRYADCQALLRDPRLVQAYVVAHDRRRPDWREREAFASTQRWMVNMDGPAHARLRRLVAGAFTPRTVEQLRPRVAGIVDELLDGPAAAGGGELMEQVAFPLPAMVIGELLGVPRGDLPPFREFAERLTASLEPRPGEAALRAADDGARHLDAYFEGFVADLRVRPRPGLLSALAEVDDRGDRLSDAELVSLGSMLMFAGFETTTHLIGNGLLALLEHRDQLDALRARPELCSNLPDELLRYDPPVRLLTRMAAKPVQVGGVTVDQDDTAVILVGAANRDPDRYAEPDRLDVTRTDVRPLAFGHGVHYCLGAALAKLEIEVLFRALLDRFGSIELSGPVVRRDGVSLRGVSSIPLALAGRDGAD